MLKIEHLIIPALLAATCSHTGKELQLSGDSDSHSVWGWQYSLSSIRKDNQIV